MLFILRIRSTRRFTERRSRKRSSVQHAEIKRRFRLSEPLTERSPALMVASRPSNAKSLARSSELGGSGLLCLLSLFLLPLFSETIGDGLPPLQWPYLRLSLHHPRRHMVAPRLAHHHWCQRQCTTRAILLEPHSSKSEFSVYHQSVQNVRFLNASRPGISAPASATLTASGSLFSIMKLASLDTLRRRFSIV